MEEQWITSVGIDIGTSTTKLIVSRLRLARVSSRLSLPKFKIVERELVYMSPIYITPLKNREEINMEEISQILKEEYEKAQLTLSQVKSGAVIITGETATKSNARQILHYLAERAGDFVVAAAGADLEGVLAGKGSGAQTRSNHIHGVIANIDIGGGTANTAAFHRGKVIGTITYHVGGRLIQLDRNGVIHYISKSIQPWLQSNGYSLEEGKTISYSFLKEITAQLSKEMLSHLTGKGRSRESNLLILGNQIDIYHPIEEIMFSGGIGQLMFEDFPKSMEEVATYGDMGPLLAHTLLEECRNYGFRVVPAVQTVRATVIGAGMQSTEISGSTIFIDSSLLPIRNLPVMKVKLDADQISPNSIESRIEQAITEGGQLFGENPSPSFALAITGLTYCSYSTLQILADAIVNKYRKLRPDEEVMVMICENDMAKALGQSIAIRCQEKPRLICIDQIQVEHGDYIDIGEPLSESMIPVVIKTLAFHEDYKVVKV